MLKLNIPRALVIKGITSSFTELKRMGFKHNKAFYLFKGNVQRLDLYDLEVICRELNCTPNDLLAWSPWEHDRGLEPGHELLSLRREQAAVGLVNLVKGLPVERMEEIEKMIYEIIKKPSTASP